MQNKKALLVIAGAISLTCVVCACLAFAAFILLPLPHRAAGATVQPLAPATTVTTSAPAATALKPTRAPRPSATARVTIAPLATAAPTLAPASQATGVPGSPGHRFVASSQAKTYYYCYTDPAWKTLKAELLWSDAESTFRAQGLKLHAPCK